jgi:hypothetical protein
MIGFDALKVVTSHPLMKFRLVDVTTFIAIGICLLSIFNFSFDSIKRHVIHHGVTSPRNFDAEVQASIPFESCLDSISFSDPLNVHQLAAVNALNFSQSTLEYVKVLQSSDWHVLLFISKESSSDLNSLAFLNQSRLSQVHLEPDCFQVVSILALVLAKNAQIFYWIEHHNASFQLSDYPRFYPLGVPLPSLANPKEQGRYFLDHFRQTKLIHHDSDVQLCTRNSFPLIQVGLCPSASINLFESPGIVFPKDLNDQIEEFNDVQFNVVSYQAGYFALFSILLEKFVLRSDPSDQQKIFEKVANLFQHFTDESGFQYDIAFLSPGSLCGDITNYYSVTYASPRAPDVIKTTVSIQYVLNQSAPISSFQGILSSNSNFFDSYTKKYLEKNGLILFPFPSQLDKTVHHLSLFYPQHCFISHPFMRDIALAIVFNNNFAKPEYLTFLTRLYSRFFSLIYFYADAESRPEDSLYSCKTSQGGPGYSAHVCLEVAIPRAAGRIGLFWTMDDVFLGLWNLLLFDPRQLWMPQLQTSVAGALGKTFSLAQAKSMYPEIMTSPVEHHAATAEFRPELKEMQMKSAKALMAEGAEFVAGVSDAFYIPRAVFSDWFALSKFSVAEFMHQEIIIPTLALATSFASDIQPLQIVQVWSPIDDPKTNQRIKPPTKHIVDNCWWSPYLSWSHPWKMATDEIAAEFVSGLTEDFYKTKRMPLYNCSRI